MSTMDHRAFTQTQLLVTIAIVGLLILIVTFIVVGVRGMTSPSVGIPSRDSNRHVR